MHQEAEKLIGKQVDEIYLSIAARAIGHLLHNAEILSKDGGGWNTVVDTYKPQSNGPDKDLPF